MIENSEAPVVDEEVLRQIDSPEEGGDQNLLHGLVRDFGQLTPQRLGHVRDLVRIVDVAAVALEARALAESCRTLGLGQMEAACTHLAEVAANAEIDGLVSALSLVERKFLEAHEALEAIDIRSL